MKKLFALMLAVGMLAGCGAGGDLAEVTEVSGTAERGEAEAAQSGPEAVFVSRFASETVVVLSDEGISVDGGGETEAVFVSHDIIYYEDRETYESGNPYGEGTAAQRHSAGEAAAHTVVNITAPGAYRIGGTLSAGQIRVDLGEDADADPQAVVELILEDADITCTVAPAILFLNTYECDGDWETGTAQAQVDTSGAGANLILRGKNRVSGSHVAKIYKDAEEAKKLWKQDGAIYSYMSMNVYGPGSLDLTADNEGLDTQLHLTIHGGDIAIRSQDDGINTNEDGVSVTTINGGNLHIIAGLGKEGDGIDSNGYLVINGGTVVACANPASDAGLDSDLGSYVNGGTVVALGATMDWAESDSDQVTMNLQFGSYQSSGSAIVVTEEDGTVVFAYDPSEDEVLGADLRRYMGAIVSCPGFVQGARYQVWMDGTVTGTEVGGVYDAATVSAYDGGTRMCYTGTDIGRGGMGGKRPGGEPPADFDGERREPPALPEGGFGGHGQRPGDFGGETPGTSGGAAPTPPEDGMPPEGTPPTGTQPGQDGPAEDGGGDLFYMYDKVNAFSGVTQMAG